MKKLLLPFVLLLMYACGSTQVQLHMINQKRSVIQNTDTCFYDIIPAADMDVPGTPHWDTNITLTATCDVQCLKMRSWGTETAYSMSGPDTLGTISRSCHFTHGSGSNLIDITGIPKGNYHFYLMACGNGGGFSVNIQ